MSVVVSVENVGPCRKQLTVEVPTPAVEAETQRVVGEFRRRLKLPGFRKGKAPVALVQRRFREDIEREVIDRLVPRYWRQAEAESALEPLLPPRVDNVDLSEGAPLTFVATVEIRPELELGNLRDFDLPEIEVEPTDEEVDQALERIRRDVAEWAPAERPAAQGDLVKMELEEIGGGDPQTVEIELGDPKVWEELSLAVSGLEAGQQTEFVRTRQGDEISQEARYRVRVLRVQERDLSPLDNALAAKVGDFESLEALREEVERRLGTEKELERRLQREKTMLDQLRQRHPVELPQGVVDEEIRHLLQEYAESLGARGVDVEGAEIDWQGLAEEVRPQAERRVHVRILVDAVADAEGIKISEEEFERRLSTLARAQGRTTVAIRQALHQAGRLAALRSQMRREKTIQWLLGEEPAAEATPTRDSEQSE